MRVLVCTTLLVVIGTDQRLAASGEASLQAAPTVVNAPDVLFNLDLFKSGGTGLMDQFAGREVYLTDVLVDRAEHSGFWTSTVSGDTSVFVFLAEGQLISVDRGARVNVHGEIRRMPDLLRRTLQVELTAETQLFIYAYTVRSPYGRTERHAILGQFHHMLSSVAAPSTASMMGHDADASGD
jgi:hypothetical protein